MLYRYFGLLTSNQIRLLLIIGSFLSVYTCSSPTLLAEIPHNTFNKYQQAQLDEERSPDASDVNEVRVFCTTVLDINELEEVLPEFAIARQPNLDLEDSDVERQDSLATSCPQEILVIKPLNEGSLTANDLDKITQTISKLYIDRGYINSRAIPSSTASDGVSQIVVDEGNVEIVVEGTRRLQKYVRSRLKLATDPLNTKKLEDQLRLLKTDPLFDNIEATLQPGETENQTQLKVEVTEARRISGSVGVDNYSPPSVGGERLGLGVAYRNLAGLGDEISLAYTPRLQNFSTYGLDFGYRVPINAKNGTIQARASINRNEVIEGQFESLDIRGESERYEINYRQPLILNPRQELAVSVGFDYQDGQTFTFQGSAPFGFGPDDDGVSRTSVLSAGGELTKRDASGAWGLRSQLRLGLGIFGATENDAPIPDGQFISLLTQLQRVQVLNDNNFLIIQGDLQLTPNSLLPSEQFSIGGGQSVRGYRSNARAGDNGFRFSVEDRLTLIRNQNRDPVFILAPFMDMGIVWESDDNPNIIPDEQFLIGLGLGFLWQPIKDLNVRLDYAPPLIDLDDGNDDIQDNGLHFSAGYNF